MPVGDNSHENTLPIHERLIGHQPGDAGQLDKVYRAGLGSLKEMRSFENGDFQCMEEDGCFRK